jgi:hypothetical protein|tara:strand:- start:6208 stop:7938 length:1731 start_codon:yes stop_codon:yes gene_type:complete
MRLERSHLPYLVLLALFLVAFFWGLSAGILGHDYFYFFPKLLDGKWHFMRQGLSMFYYTPHMCGGFPEYANPQSMYYSLQQFLVLFLDMWLAVRLTILISMCLAYVGWYRVGKDLIKLNMHWAHLLALIITAHGYHFMHMIPGHIVFHSMPMIGWLLWLLFDRRELDRKGLMLKGAWFALATAYILYSGGYMVAVMALFAVIVLLPYELILHAATLSSRLKILIKNILVCGIGGLLINASKLVATFSFIRYFPREVPFERLWDDTSILVYIFRALFALPQNNDLYWEFGMGKWGAFHEYSFLVSPVILIGLGLGVYLLWKKRSTVLRHKVQLIVTAATSLVLLLLLMQLMQGYGWMVTPLETLPIFRGLHVNMRWLYAFSFLPILTSVWCLQQCFSRYSRSFVIVGGVITIVAFVGGYYGILHTNTLPRTLPYDEILAALETQEDYLDLDVEEAFDMRDMGHSGFIPLIFGGNHIYCSEPMLLGTSNLPDTIRVAKIMNESDGVLNIYNPACMVYPKENDCEPGDRILVSDKENAERFRTGQKTTWKMSGLQHISNWISILTLIGCVVIIVVRRKK